MKALVTRLLRSDSAFALAIILPTLAGCAAIGFAEFIVLQLLKGVH